MSPSETTTDISELPDTPKRRDISYYIVLFCLVLPMWSFIPFSWGYVIYTLRYSSITNISMPRLVFLLMTICEVFFSLYHYTLAKQVSGPCLLPPGRLSDLQTAFSRVLKAGLAQLPEEGYDEETTAEPRPGSPEEDIVQLEAYEPRAIDFRNTLRNWFHRAPWSTITLHAVRQWAYWSIFNADLPPLETLPHSHRAALDDVIEQLQKRVGKRIVEGSSAHTKPLRLTLDDVNISWRPFSFYCLVAFANLLLKLKYQRDWNFQYGNEDGLEYLLRIPEGWNPSRGPRPILFIHGLGLGLMQYNVLIGDLVRAFDDRPLLIILQPHISQNIFHPRFLRPMGRKDTVQRISRLLDALGWVDAEKDLYTSEEEEKEHSLAPKSKKGVTLLSHSNGSYVHAWMLKDCPRAITRSCFADPVTFVCWEGDVCYNFIYKTCTNGTELLIRYFVGTELGVANLLQRHFDWSSNSLWYEEIPNARDPSKTLFLLGGKDSILNAKRVKKYLTSHGVRKGIWYDPNGRHGQALLAGGKGLERVTEWLRETDL